jgi:hypothetical protein
MQNVIFPALVLLIAFMGYEADDKTALVAVIFLAVGYGTCYLVETLRLVQEPKRRTARNPPSLRRRRGDGILDAEVLGDE